MDIRAATKQYETWLGKHIDLIQKDIATKHERMAQDAFSFLRATFYRWMQLFPELCPKLMSAPRVLSVGDLHVENYGTWRDAEGRLIWGINDFDEAFPLPYTVDLVRLATSAAMAIRLNHLQFTATNACTAVLDGYTDTLGKGGRPYVLSEKHVWLRDAVTSRLRDPVAFWEKFATLRSVKPVTPKALTLLKQSMPARDLKFRTVHRQAGLGSLGRERFTAIAEWQGGNVAREAKALTTSACVWAGGLRDKPIYYSQIAKASIRAQDPFLSVNGGWVLRRLAPYCSRIELQQLPRGPYAEKLLRAMGRELANVHLGTRVAIKQIQGDLKKRGPKWLLNATNAMMEAVFKDWKAWRK